MRITVWHESVWPPSATQTAFTGEAVLSHSSPHALLSNSSKVRHLLYGLREGGKEGRRERGERKREKGKGRETGKEVHV